MTSTLRKLSNPRLQRMHDRVAKQRDNSKQSSERLLVGLRAEVDIRTECNLDGKYCIVAILDGYDIVLHHAPREQATCPTQSG